MAKFSLIILICLCGIAVADIYLHFPPGSNDRNREQKDNRDNAQRLFDSENNAKGGYPYCGSATLPGDTDGYEFYAESRLRIEWTLQHSCGSEANALCNTILQYMCSDSIGDGYPTGSEIQNQDPGYSKAEFLSTANNRQNQDGTATIPFPSSLNGGGPAFGDTSFDNDPEVYTKFYSGEIKTPWNRVEFGYHEPFEHYKKCIKTQRNSGLYTADRRLNGQSQRFTRQNPGGTRHGLECPEERDYYPHWSPSPWKDIAVFTSNTDWCPYYRENSENVKGRWFCELDATTQLIPITENDCKAAAGRWKQASSHGIKAPECLAHPISRDNHLGNVMGELPTNAKGSTDMATYDWIIPKDLEGKKCVIRMRYNMSSGDYNSMNWLHSKDSFDSASHGEFSDYTKVILIPHLVTNNPSQFCISFDRIARPQEMIIPWMIMIST